jgi:hypothetical protein
MDDMMLDLTAGNQMLRRRLDAYADARLSPEPAAAARMRARVMAAAHRQAALTSAGAGLTLLTTEPPVTRRALARHPATRIAGVLLSAALGLSLAVGTALAADAGGLFYPARLGLETLLLPTDPSERAIAELARLESRLHEAQAASERGDSAALSAAMDAYTAIVTAASRDAIAAHDPVASAALEAGVSRNIAVLQAILERAPAAAVDGLTRAIERSDTTLDDIHGAAGGNDGGNGGGGPSGPGATDAPTAVPTDEPAASDPTKEPKPTKAPTDEPTPRTERTPRPERTPDRTPPGQGPDDPGRPSGGD